jgi:hypothetical protein
VRGWLIVLSISALSAHATAAPTPTSCWASIDVAEDFVHGTITGKLTRGPAKDTARIDDGKKPFAFILRSGTPLSVADGDTVTLTYACGGWGNRCDARLDDATGNPIAIMIAFGSDSLSDGWASKPGTVLTQKQDPNQKKKSVRRTHELVLAKGKLTVKAKAASCTRIKDGKTSWLVTGEAVTWDGVRPPEGVDAKQYALIREQ